MYPVSDTFLAAVVTSHVATARAAVLIEGAEVADIPFTSGSVSIDARREGPRRTLSLSCTADDTLWGYLSTLGAEVAVWRGIGDEEVPLGIFVIDSDLERGRDESVSISASDRSVKVSRAQWVDPFQIAVSTDIGTAIEAIIVDRAPTVPVSIGTVGKTLGAQVVYQGADGTDPWKDARAMASDHGYDLYVDAEGTVRVQPEPDPVTAPVTIRYEYGQMRLDERPRLLGDVYNGVIVTGEGSGVDTPVMAQAWVEDESAPDYRYGPMGQVPYRYSSPLLTTQAMADAAAATILAKKRGRLTQTSWQLIVNPAHDAFDVVEFVDEDGASQRAMLDSLTVPLGRSETMPVVGRETRAL